MTEAETAQLANLGTHADVLLGNPAFAEALSRMRDQLRDEWLLIPVYDTQALQLVTQRAKLLERFEETLHAMVRGGKQAAQDLDKARDADLRLVEKRDLSPIELHRASVQRRRRAG